MNNLHLRFKVLLSDRSMIFWTLIFPMLLSIFFSLALRSAYAEARVRDIPLAVVVKDDGIQSFLNILQDDYALITQTAFDSVEAAEKALINGEVEGIVSDDKQLSLSFSKAAYTSEITVINNVFESYNTKQALLSQLITDNPAALNQAVIESLYDDQNYVKTIVDSKSEDLVLIHYFTTIAMLCLYAADWGNKSGQYLQADMSAIGIRNNIAPTPKYKLLLTDIFVVYAIFMAEFFIHVSFLHFILNVSFGQNALLVILTGLCGGLLTTTLGYMICVSIQGSEGKRSVLISMVGLFMSFLSGMMSPSIKYALESISPLFSKLNPASLITDNFFWIYRNTNLNVVYLNLAIMLGLSLVFGIMAFRKLNGVSYDHL